MRAKTILEDETLAGFMYSTLYAVLWVYSYARWELLRRLRSLLLRLHDVFQALINSLVCWFSTGVLGPTLFQNIENKWNKENTGHISSNGMTHERLTSHTISCRSPPSLYQTEKNVSASTLLSVHSNPSMYAPQRLVTPRRPSPQQQQSQRSYTSLRFTTWLYLFFGFISNSWKRNNRETTESGGTVTEIR